MATIDYFYDSATDYLDYGSYFHLFMAKWMADQFLNSEYSRVVYSDNGYALRKRSNSVPVTNEGNAGLPFINFIQTGGQGGNPQDWYHWRLDKAGVYVPEMETKVRMVPVLIPYESTYWCASQKEMRYIANKLYFFQENHTDFKVEIEYTYSPEGGGADVTVQVPHYVKMNFTNINVEPDYEYNSWFHDNRYHSIQIDFEIHTWGMLLNDNFHISDNAIVQFTNSFDKYTADYWDKIITKG